MHLKKEEPSSGNSMAQAGSFENCAKTNHDYSYTEKVFLFLGSKYAHGSNNRRSHERNILCKTIS